MIDQAIMLRPVVEALVTLCSRGVADVRAQVAEFDVTPEEWQLLDWLQELLLPFVDVTTHVESETVPTAHRVLPWHAALLAELGRSRARAPDDAAREAVDAGVAELAAYGGEQLTDPLYVATFLDPRRRTRYFQTARGQRSVDEVSCCFFYQS
jgi:hypothetical protein